MMNEIFIGLEAKDPEANRLRSWQVEAGPDLFGVWTVKVCFGRIGTVGRAVRHDFASKAAQPTIAGWDRPAGRYDTSPNCWRAS
jgi:predicted DNA-binding WGR domain protein